MPRLPRIRTGSDGLDAALEQWKAVIDPSLPLGAEPLLVPRNARTSRPAPNTIRVRWDPGGIHAEGHDIQYSESADFSQSQSHRINGLEARFFDLTVQDTKKRYFRIRSFIGERVSRWSNIKAGIAEIVAPPVVPLAGVKFVNFSLGGSLVVGTRVTPKPPARLRGENEGGQPRGRCIFVQGNVDTPGTTRSVFDIWIQPADENEPRYSILAPGDAGKLIIPANTREQTIMEAGDLGDVDARTFLDGDFFTLDILEAGTGAGTGHVLVGFIILGEDDE